MNAARGFTLLEVLVALAIFALVAASILTASARSLQTAARLEDKTLALWIADNAINQGVGSAFDNDVIDAFQWFANPDGNLSTTDDVPDVAPDPEASSDEQDEARAPTAGAARSAASARKSTRFTPPGYVIFAAPKQDIPPSAPPAGVV